MQYLDIQSDGIRISKEMPIALLEKAVRSIESTLTTNGKAVEVLLHDRHLTVSGEGEVSDIEPLIQGLTMIERYLDPGSYIDIQHVNWEVNIVLMSDTVH